MQSYKEMLEEVKRFNLCTHYILPLTGVTRDSFAEALFLNSYLDVQHRLIIVNVVMLDWVPEPLVKKAKKVWSIPEKNSFLAYEIHEMWTRDIERFCKGKYSEMSFDAKEIIKERSGLVYRESAGSGTYSHFILLALDKAPEFKIWLEEQLGVDELKGELLSEPSPGSFMVVS